MKRWIHAATTPSNVIKLDVVFEAELTELFDSTDMNIAAATIRGIYIPEGELMPAEKDAIFSSQCYTDFCTFNEGVNDLLADYCGLDVYYKNESDTHSFYFGSLAKAADGTLLVDFTCVLRISTHDPVRSKSSQKHKKEREEALQNRIGDSKKAKGVKVIPKSITVNRETFDSYADAFFHVCDFVDTVVKKIKYREKYVLKHTNEKKKKKH